MIQALYQALLISVPWESVSEVQSITGTISAVRFQFTAVQMSVCYCYSVCTSCRMALILFCGLAQCSCPATKSQLRHLFIVQGVLLETHYDAQTSTHNLSSDYNNEGSLSAELQAECWSPTLAQ